MQPHESETTSLLHQKSQQQSVCCNGTEDVLCEFHTSKTANQEEKTCVATNCPSGYQEHAEEYQESTPVPEEDNVSFFGRVKEFLKFLGPAILVSVGYVDPGNWATDIVGGAVFQYKLLWVILLSNAIAIVVQSLAAKLGLATGKDLAQQCYNYYPKKINFILWVLAELAIGATDLAEVLGTAIGLNLLFGIPMLWGVLITAGDTLVFLVFQQLGHRIMEFFIFLLMVIISGCFVVLMFYSKPSFTGMVRGYFIPSLPPGSLSVAVGILGATIMPHNMYLHSGLVLSRQSQNHSKTKRHIIYAILDSVLSLNLAVFVNSAILIVSAATFFDKEQKPQIIQEAYVMLERYFGSLSAILFAVGLLCAGQSSTITGTLAGQMVMEGFIQWKIWPWLRRLLTRLVAIVPAVIVIVLTGDDGTYLLVWSQVVLSIQLPFAMIPLLRITNHDSMGSFKNGLIVRLLGWVCVVIVVALNVWLLIDEVWENLLDAAVWVWVIVGVGVLCFAVMLLVTLFYPISPKENTTIKEEKPVSINSA